MINNILSTIVGIIMFFGFFNFIKCVSGSKYIRKRFLGLFIMLYTIVYVGMVYILVPEITTIMSLISIAIGCKIFFNLSKRDLIFYTIIEWAIAILLDILIMNIFNKIVILGASNQEIYRLLGTLTIAIIFFILGRIGIVIKVINKIKEKLYKINHFIYILIFIVILYLGLGSYCLDNINEISSSMIALVCSVFFLVLIILFIHQQSQIIFLKENIKLLTKNNEFFVERIDEYRIIKHNLVANLNGIKSVANKKSTLLIDELIKKYKSKIKMPNNFKKLPSGINGIILEKIYNIEQKKIKVSINNYIKNNIIEELSAKDYNLFCEALGVALDNAIEATIESKEKLILIDIKEENEKIILTIVNTFSGIIDIDDLGNKYYTSKKKGHGLGLFSILNFKTVKVSTYIKENKFFCVLKVNKQK